MTNRTRWLLCGLALAVVTAGCTQTVLESGEAEVSANYSSGTWADRQRAVDVQVAQCMRTLTGLGEDIIFVNPELIAIAVELPAGFDDAATSAAVRGAFEVCSIEYPPIPHEDHPISVAQAEAYYTALMASGQCLRELGYPISDPPSRAVIIDDLMSPPWGAWDPWMEILLWQDPQHSWQTAISECPRPSIWDFAN